MGDVAARVLQRLGLSGDAALMIEGALERIYSVEIVDSDDVGSGGTTRAGVGFQIKDYKGDVVAEEVLLAFGVYDDEELVTTATTAVLNTASAGTILSGAASASLVVKTNAVGLFTCTLTDTADETVYMGCGPVAGSPIVDCRDTDAVTFSA